MGGLINLAPHALKVAKTSMCGLGHFQAYAGRLFSRLFRKRRNAPRNGQITSSVGLLQRLDRFHTSSVYRRAVGDEGLHDRGAPHPRQETTRELAEKLRPEWHNLMTEAKEVTFFFFLTLEPGVWG